VIAIVSDTHGTDDHRLAGRTLEAVREADLVVHAGDFTTAAVLDAFEAESDAFLGVYGNNDDPEVRERLPAERTFERGGVRFALTHRKDGGETGLAMFGRERDADVVVFGHSHRPGFDRAGSVGLLNPGSHADPRWYRPGHAELLATEDGFAGKLLEPDGTAIARFRVESRE
jgi:putative phosphoesterase